MTTPNGAIVFNATSGSDTQSSGLGPATALYGSGATTDGTAVVTGITTTGVTAGDLLWVQTSSGRQFSIVASVDSGTQVTCDDTFAVGLGQTWAIGGKRATFNNADSRKLFSSDGEDFAIATETDQNLTGTALDISVECSIFGSGGIKTIDQSADAACFGESVERDVYLSQLKFTNSNSSSTSSSIAYKRNGDIFAVNCIFGDATNQLYSAIEHINGRTAYRLSGCVIQHCLHNGVQPSHPISSGVYQNCVFHSNAERGLQIDHTSTSVLNCVFANNGNDGFRQDSSQANVQIVNSIFYNNGGRGLRAYLDEKCSVINCAFYGNTQEAVYSDVASGRCVVYGNFAQSSQTYGNFDIGSDVTALTADIFVDEAADDFNLNSDSGGGALLIAHKLDYETAEIRPFRWLDAAAASSGSSSSSGSKWTTITDLTGLVAWYKPETLASTYSNGDSISTWADSSGNGHDLTGSGTTRPLALANAFGTYMAADFDGTDDKLWSSSFTATQEPHHFYIVVEVDVLKNWNEFLCIDDNPSSPFWSHAFFHLFAYSDGAVSCTVNTNQFARTEDSIAGNTGLTASTPIIISASSFLYDESSTNCHMGINLNGGRAGQGSGTLAASGTAYIGMGVIGVGTALDGRVVEAIITKGNERGVDAPWIEGYLADKYGITLADGHLFKNAAPQSSPTTYNATGSGSSYTNVAAAKFTRLE